MKQNIEIIKCQKCGKEFKLITTKFPCKMEAGRLYNTYYWCPYCGQTFDVTIGPDEDVSTSKIK